MASDFISQLFAQLRQSSALVAALGEDTAHPATTKIHGDVANGSPQLPYLVITEESETPRYQSPDAEGVAVHFDRGTIRVAVFAQGKLQARSIGTLVAGILNDAPIAPSDGTLLELRQSAASFRPIGDLAPDSSTVACRVIDFLYVIQRQS